MRAFEHGRFCWHDLATNDLEDARRFYGALFGWTAEARPLDGGRSYTVFSDAETEVAGAYSAGPECGDVPPHWTCYVAVDDVDAAIERAAGLGGRTCFGPVDAHDIGRMAAILDPTGAAIALWTERRRPGAPIPAPRPGRFCWDELATREIDLARRFYGELLGWNAVEREMPGGRYTVFTRGDEMRAGAISMTEAWADAPPHWMPYVMVADCDETARAAARHGGVIRVPPTDIPPIGRFAVLSDPAGAVFSVITFSEQD